MADFARVVWQNVVEEQNLSLEQMVRAIFPLELANPYLKSESPSFWEERITTRSIDPVDARLT